MSAPRLARLALLCALLVAVPGTGRAGSDLLLPVPDTFGAVPAATYDEEGHRVGDAQLIVEKLDGDKVRMFARSGYDGDESARNVVSAVLARTPDGKHLRLLQQSSRSFDEQGQPLGELQIDHVKGEGSCTPPEGHDGRRVLELPDHERVANIPVNLLFLPLATGESKEVDFQIFLCRGQPRIVDARATVARRVKTEDGLRDIVEVKYDLDFGPLLSRLAAPFVPKVAVWFDPDRPGGWLAHRMPLFAKGPTVLVVRTGVAPQELD